MRKQHGGSGLIDERWRKDVGVFKNRRVVLEVVVSQPEKRLNYAVEASSGVRVMLEVTIAGKHGVFRGPGSIDSGEILSHGPFITGGTCVVVGLSECII